MGCFRIGATDAGTVAKPAYYGAVSWVLLALSCCPLLGQQKSNPITSMRDLKLGMPHDYVLPKLLEVYKLEKEYGNENEGSWRVLSRERMIGELGFESGRLSFATVRIYAGQDVGELLDALFTSIYENSGNPKIKEGPGENLSRSRTALIGAEAREITSALTGKTVQTRLLLLNVGQKEYRLTSGIQEGGGKAAWLDEMIVTVWKDGLPPKKPQKPLRRKQGSI